MLRFWMSLEMFTPESKLKLDLILIHSVSFIVLFDPRDRMQCACADPPSGSVTPVCKVSVKTCR